MDTQNGKYDRFEKNIRNDTHPALYVQLKVHCKCTCI